MKTLVKPKFLVIAIVVICVLYKLISANANEGSDQTNTLSSVNADAVPYQKNKPSIRYEVVESGAHLVVVHLKEPFYKTVDSTDLNHIADSLFEARLAPAAKDAQVSFIVRFYYRTDYKNHMCFAIKSWDYAYDQKKFIPSRMEVTGVTGNKRQDSINLEKMYKPIQTSFDTTAYLQRVKSFSKKQINQLIAKQLQHGQVAVFLQLCQSKLDSAGVISDGKDSYWHLYRDHFVNVGGNVSYPITKNNFTYSKTIIFEGSYDIFGNQVYFKAHF